MEDQCVVKKNSRWTGIRNFIKLLKIDLVLLPTVLGILIQGVTVTQLAEDKMCINQLHYSREYCLTLTSNHSKEIGAELVLKHANSLKNWQTFITNVPTTIMAAFLGYFIDKYPKYFKLVLIAPLIGTLGETLILLMNAFFFKLSSWAILFAYIPMALGGGGLFITSACFTYISWSTPPHLVIIRFAFMDFVINMAMTIGTYIGGDILAMEPYFEDQIENYIGILALSFIFTMIGLLFALTLRFEGIPEGDPEYASMTHGQVIKDVFQVSRMTELFKAAYRKRENNGRLRLLALILSSVLISSCNAGDGSINYQYAQRVYSWSAKEYTKIFGIVNLVPALLTPITPNVFKLGFKAPDTVIGLIGAASVFAMNLIRGAILNATGFVIVSLFSVTAVIAPVAIKSLISVIADPHEVAKVFTLISVTDSYLSLGSTFLYTSVFSGNILDNPGLIYKIVSLLLLIPIGTCLWLELTRSKWKPKFDIEPQVKDVSSMDVNGNPASQVKQANSMDQS